MIATDLTSHLCLLTALIDQRLSALIQKRSTDLRKDLFEAARYSLLSSGKRMRPILALATAEIYDVPVELALTPACALELVHTYSLIHDDLPCMDDDDLRRGKPTLHKVYSEGHAVLTGDFLLTFAFQVLSECQGLSAEQKNQLIYTLSHRAGAEGMIGGQVVDLSHCAIRIDWETLEFMHLHKTAALITAALEYGGILGNACEEEMQLLRTIGRNLGLAFQIIDDLLDVIGSESILGKPIGSDRENQKTTAVSLLGIEGAKDAAEKLFSEASSHLKALSKPAPFLHFLAQKILHREK